MILEFVFENDFRALVEINIAVNTLKNLENVFENRLIIIFFKELSFILNNKLHNIRRSQEFLNNSMFLLILTNV